MGKTMGCISSIANQAKPNNMKHRPRSLSDSLCQSDDGTVQTIWMAYVTDSFLTDSVYKTRISRALRENSPDYAVFIGDISSEKKSNQKPICRYL